MKLKTQHYIGIGLVAGVALNWNSIMGLFEGKTDSGKLQDRKKEDLPPPKAFPIFPSTRFNSLVKQVQEGLILHNLQSKRSILTSGGADGKFGNATKKALTQAGFKGESISQETHRQLLLLIGSNSKGKTYEGVESPDYYAKVLYRALYADRTDKQSIFRVYKEFPSQVFHEQVKAAYDQLFDEDLMLDMQEELEESELLQIDQLIESKALSGIACGCTLMKAPIDIQVKYLDGTSGFIPKGEIIGERLQVRNGIAVFKRPNNQVAAFKFK